MAKKNNTKPNTEISESKLNKDNLTRKQEVFENKPESKFKTAWRNFINWFHFEKRFDKIQNLLAKKLPNDSEQEKTDLVYRQFYFARLWIFSCSFLWVALATIFLWVLFVVAFVVVLKSYLSQPNPSPAPIFYVEFICYFAFNFYLNSLMFNRVLSKTSYKTQFWIKWFLCKLRIVKKAYHSEYLNDVRIPVNCTSAHALQSLKTYISRTTNDWKSLQYHPFAAITSSIQVLSGVSEITSPVGSTTAFTDVSLLTFKQIRSIFKEARQVSNVSIWKKLKITFLIFFTSSKKTEKIKQKIYPYFAADTKFKTIEIWNILSDKILDNEVSENSIDDRTDLSKPNKLLTTKSKTNNSRKKKRGRKYDTKNQNQTDTGGTK